MENVKPPRRNNSLTQSQAARLYRWLDESRRWASETVAQKVAVKAAEELRFGVTSSNVLSAKRALGIHKPAPVASCHCSELSGAIETLATALNDLYRQAHATAPAEIRALAGQPELPLRTTPLRFEPVEERAS